MSEVQSDYVLSQGRVMMTKSIDEMRAMCDAATPGPWSFDYMIDRVYGGFRRIFGGHKRRIGELWSEPDAAFIAAAREWVPWAIERIAQLQPQAEALRERQESYEEHLTEMDLLLAENVRLVDLLRGAWICPGCMRDRRDGIRSDHATDCPARPYLVEVGGAR